MNVVVMDLTYNLGYYLALFVIPFVLYFLLFKRNNGHSVYTGRDWFYLIKLYFAKNAVKRYKEKFRSQIAPLKEDFETGFNIPSGEHTNSQHFYGVDQKDNSLSLKFTVRYEKIAEVFLYLRLEDGNVYIFPDENGLRLTKIPNDEWKINGLSIEILEPFIRYRIIFNGLLRNVSIKNYEKVEYVHFSFIFNSSGSPTYIPHDMDSNLLADALARENWRDGSWVDYLVNQSGYEQFGALRGTLRNDTHKEELVLHLPACRTYHVGIDDRFLLQRALRVFIADTYGNLINVVIKSFKDGCSQMNYGSAILSDNRIVPINGVDISLRHMSCYKIFPEMITTEINVGKKLFKCVVHLNATKSVVAIDEEEDGFECYNIPAECDVNTNQAKAVLEFWNNKNGPDKFKPNNLLRPKVVDTLPGVLVTNITSKEARILAFTGGKGNSLALLSSLESPDFIIPEGFVVTVNAFKHQLQANPVLVKTVLLLDDVCRGLKDGKVEAVCNDVINFIKKEKMLREIEDAIKQELKNIGNKDSFGWAVRSSAIGEDSEELSAAGQNDTFLGCLTEEQILKSVSACWASLFTYQSVQYRLQHGMPVLSEMAVVVQKMVPADAAGVLFTCHPFSFNPSQMVITSNYGLGETVVSGKSDPDTFVLDRTWDDKVSLLDRNIGRKSKILKMTDTGLEEIDKEGEFEFVENPNWSITESQALQLGRLGVFLEKTFGGPRDVEWAFYKDNLYLLQSRPITTLNSWSEFDLTHELDYPIRSDCTVVTVANIGEVIPNAMSVLTQTTSLLCTSQAMSMRMNCFDPCGMQFILRSQHRGLLDVVNFLHKNVNEDVKVSSIILDLAIFGHAVLDEKMNDICKKIRGVASSINILKEVVELLRLALRNKNIPREMKEKVSNLPKELNIDDPLLENYKKIDNLLYKLPYMMKNHAETSSVSVFYQVLAMNILLEGSQTLTQDHCADFATILSSVKDVVSAEVPTYLENIARIIRDEGYDEAFCTIKPEFGVAWLEKKCPEAFKLFQEFLEKHGHRSQGEFEVMDESWAENPSKVISMIQANAKHDTSAIKSDKNVKDISKSLVSPKSSITRAIIKFIINRIQSSVSNRELTKYELVKAVDILKQAYRTLSKQMVSKGLLPSPDLIYHLTHYEIGQIIQNRNPPLITKAIQRRKLYPKWNKLKFPEVSFGVPVPENEADQLEDLVDKVCVGTAACAGTVKARACVIRSLKEIDQLQAGDILITVSTDIGWSPYFPILSGIVTELGGLISHGAVVAREYGLPCIVGVKEATKVFRTGDIVVLSGSTGRIGKATDFLEVL